MSITVCNSEISAISIIDDNEASRTANELPIEDLDVIPYSVQGPLLDIESLLKKIQVKSQAALCDHHLTISNYAQFNGAELVARWYQMHFPAILCTRYEKANIDEMRRYRKHIPVLLDPNELDPDIIVRGLERCFQEFSNNFQPTRRTWRTLIRIEDIAPEKNKDNPYVYTVVPGWNSNEVIRLLWLDIPPEIREVIGPNTRFHAHVNIGAERSEDLFFDKWETS